VLSLTSDQGATFPSGELAFRHLIRTFSCFLVLVTCATDRRPWTSYFVLVEPGRALIISVGISNEVSGIGANLSKSVDFRMSICPRAT
jgi:hypothetical protein